MQVQTLEKYLDHVDVSTLQGNPLYLQLAYAEETPETAKEIFDLLRSKKVLILDFFNFFTH